MNAEHLGRRFMRLAPTRRFAILDDLIGPLEWPDEGPPDWIALLRIVHQRGLVANLAERTP